MTKKELVKQTISFDGPGRVPIWMFNRDQEDGDMLSCGLGLPVDGRNEWGYKFESLDATMGQVTTPVLPSWDALDAFHFPELNPECRLAGARDFKAAAGDHYLLGGLGITGFNLYTFLRGFGKAMVDFLTERERAEFLLDRIMGFEMDLIAIAAAAGLDGVHFADDWGSQEGLFISPDLWRDLFKPRYEAQFRHAHHLGLDVWFHSCGDISDIVPDMHDIGVDVMNISQPNACNLDYLSSLLRGKQCFLMPVSYQTDSISGTPAGIIEEVRRLHRLLGTARGGFVGYVEEYGCMGMTEENYQACVTAFQSL
jgi:uroporphyrinogen decarboxylase